NDAGVETLREVDDVRLEPRPRRVAEELGCELAQLHPLGPVELRELVHEEPPAIARPAAVIEHTIPARPVGSGRVTSSPPTSRSGSIRSRFRRSDARRVAST